MTAIASLIAMERSCLRRTTRRILNSLPVLLDAITNRGSRVLECMGPGSFEVGSRFHHPSAWANCMWRCSVCLIQLWRLACSCMMQC